MKAHYLYLEAEKTLVGAMGLFLGAYAVLSSLHIL